ncbi:DUF3169 family protein [Planococcus beigongshangi]|uniref:DUF3169 family protein n=1 Tax=Planococcus beigongshangi TaxID=2782536 RepID=UPI00193B8BD3|nr:DUF3169 family protein [Planococcus beigongshangi]
MKKILTTSGKLLIGALIGFFGMLALLEAEITFDFGNYAYPASIVILAAAAVLIVFSLYCYSSIRKTAKQDLSGDAEDAAEGKMYRQYSDANLSITLALLFGLAAVCLALLTEQPVWTAVTGVVLTFISFVVSFLLPGLMHKMYPERNLPSISDKDYANKLLESSDDGEKHVMLDGLYKTYLSLNSLLIGAIILLLLYSMVTGASQLFGIFVVVAILAVTNAQYMFSIRNK